MASGFYNSALYDLWRGSIDLDTDTLKLVLVDTSYTYDPDHVFVDEAGADTAAGEIVATNYTGAFGGAGRKTATVTGNANNTNNRADFAIADVTWTTLGGATNDTIHAANLVKEITNDAASKVICSFDVTDTSTNGSDITLDYLALASGGNMRCAA